MVRPAHTEYSLPNVEMKYQNLMINGKSIFDQPVKNYLRAYDNNQKTTTGQRDNYSTGCLLDYPSYFKVNCLRFE